MPLYACHPLPVNGSPGNGWNHLYYHLLHRAREARAGHQTLFVHLPVLPEQAAGKGWPSLGLKVMTDCVREVIAECMGR